MRALLLLLLSATLSAAGLKVGDPAPATRPETMLQGEAVKDFQKGEVYVFECWASWCGPCIAAIPHLNELHKQMGKKGVVITGVNVWESERDAASAQRAKDFLKSQGDKMSYRVALGGKAFIKDWLEAAEVNGIPHAFVVADGKIAWAGHPAQLTAEMLGDILTGTPLAAAPPVADKIPQRRLSKPAVPAARNACSIGSLCATWPSSWAITAANCSGVSAISIKPRITMICPPGRAKALIIS